MQQGAEAIIEEKQENILKKRLEKKYRNEELDKKMRTGRTDEELKNIRRARKYGVKVPETEKIDESTLEQDRIDGKLLKKIIKEKTEITEELGKNIARLHSADVIHGDLTTSNVILSRERELYLIDFGLSQVSDRVEDKAVDIHLLKQVLDSSHPEVSKEAWENFLEAYRGYEESEKVLDRLEEVESRGRYR